MLQELNLGFPSCIISIVDEVKGVAKRCNWSQSFSFEVPPSSEQFGVHVVACFGKCPNDQAIHSVGHV